MFRLGSLLSSKSQVVGDKDVVVEELADRCVEWASKRRKTVLTCTIGIQVIDIMSKFVQGAIDHVRLYCQLFSASPVGE